MPDSDKIIKRKKRTEKYDQSKKSKSSSLLGKLPDLVFFILFILGGIGIILFLALFPYGLVYISGGMPQPSGDRISFMDYSQMYHRGNLVQIENTEITVTDAFTCMGYDSFSQSLLISSVTYYPKENSEFLFIGISAKSLTPTGSKILPEMHAIFLDYNGNLTAGFLPTDGTPFHIYKINNRSTLPYPPFSALPYGYSIPGYTLQTKQNTTEIQSGYIVFSKPIGVPLKDYRIVIVVDNKPLVWSLSEF